MKRIISGDFLNTRHLPSRLAALFAGIYAMIMLFIGINSANSLSTAVFISIAALSAAGAIAALMYNYGAYFKICGTDIDAKFAWNTRLVCSVSDIKSAGWRTDTENPHVNTVFITLKNGKKYTVRYLSNADAIGEYLAGLTK